MNQDPRQEGREHELTIHVFSVSAAMVGVCLAAMSCICAIIAYALF